MSEDAARLVSFSDRIIETLAEKIPNAYLIGHRYRRLPGHLCLGFRGQENEGITLLLELNEAGIAASSGSACSAQVTVSDEAIGYPYVKNPDVLIVMSPDAYTQFAPQLKPGGILLYEKELIALDDKLPTGVKAFGVPATRFAEELGRRLVLNIVMTGFFTGVTGVVSFDAAEKAVKSSVPKGTEDLNLRAFRKGYEYGRDQVAGGN